MMFVLTTCSWRPFSVFFCCLMIIFGTSDSYWAISSFFHQLFLHLLRFTNFDDLNYKNSNWACNHQYHMCNQQSSLYPILIMSSQCFILSSSSIAVSTAFRLPSEIMDRRKFWFCDSWIISIFFSSLV